MVCICSYICPLPLWMLTTCSFAGNITQVKYLEMNYANYETSIVQAYGVQLINWPLETGLLSPLQITNTADMHKLCNVLKSGECKWRQLTIMEVEAHASELDAHHAGGEVVTRPRKRRLDAGVKCKRQEDGVNTENERPKKQKKDISSMKVMGRMVRAKRSQAPVSHEVLSDSDDYGCSSGEAGSDDK